MCACVCVCCVLWVMRVLCCVCVVCAVCIVSVMFTHVASRRGVAWRAWRAWRGVAWRGVAWRNAKFPMQAKSQSQDAPLTESQSVVRAGVVAQLLRAKFWRRLRDLSPEMGPPRNCEHMPSGPSRLVTSGTDVRVGVSCGIVGVCCV